MPPFRRRGGDVEELNLIPLMNLFVTMIPLLLLTAAFTSIGMVSVSVPTQAAEESSIPTSAAAVTANVRVTRAGFEVTATSAALAEEELAALDATLPRKGGRYDYAGLTRLLAAYKGRFPRSDTVLLVPERDVRYQDLVTTMDAARNLVTRRGGKKRKTPLFPVVVVSSLVE